MIVSNPPYYPPVNRAAIARNDHKRRKWKALEGAGGVTGMDSDREVARLSTALSLADLAAAIRALLVPTVGRAYVIVPWQAFDDLEGAAAEAGLRISAVMSFRDNPKVGRSGRAWGQQRRVV